MSYHNLRTPKFVLAAAVASLTTTAAAQESPTPSRSVESYKSWSVECTQIVIPEAKPAKGAKKVEGADAKKKFKQVCETIQPYYNQKTGNEVARLAFAVDSKDKKKLVAAVRTMADVSFAKSPSILTGDKELVSGKFRRCLGNYCYAFFEMSAKTLETLQKAKDAKVRYPIGSGALLQIKVSTDGLSVALTALRSKLK